MNKILTYLFTFIVLFFSITAHAEDYVLTLKDHQFSPAEITIPANTRVKLIVKNDDTTPAEFESHDLHREKIIKGNSQAIIYVGPIKAGSYRFFDEFHEDTAQGTLIAK